MTWKPIQPYRAMSVRTPRLLLRPFRAGDFKSWQESHPAHTRQDFQKKLQRHLQTSREHRIFVFGVFDRKTGVAQGSVDLFVLNRELRWANLGYEIFEKFRENGYATEAARAALKLAFGPLALHRVEAACEKGHFKSRNVAKKAGFVAEGVRRKFFAAQGGIDMEVFGINAIDYKNKRGRYSPRSPSSRKLGNGSRQSRPPSARSSGKVRASSPRRGKR